MTIVTGTRCQLLHRELHDLLERTIKRGEGNSVILMGAKGTGKSSVGQMHCNQFPNPP